MADLYTGTNLPAQVIEKIGGSSNGRFADDTPKSLKYLCTDLYPPQSIAPENAILRQAFVHGENSVSRALWTHNLKQGTPTREMLDHEAEQLDRVFTSRQEEYALGINPYRRAPSNPGESESGE